MDYIQVMSDAFYDELEKISAAGCATPGKKIRSGGKGLGLAKGGGKGPLNLKLRQGRRPIRADKLAKMAGAEKTLGQKALSSPYARAMGLGAGLGVLGMGVLPGEARKYQLGRAIHRQQKRALREQRRASG